MLQRVCDHAISPYTNRAQDTRGWRCHEATKQMHHDASPLPGQLSCLTGGLQDAPPTPHHTTEHTAHGTPGAWTGHRSNAFPEHRQRHGRAVQTPVSPLSIKHIPAFARLCKALKRCFNGLGRSAIGRVC